MVALCRAPSSPSVHFSVPCSWQPIMWSGGWTNAQGNDARTRSKQYHTLWEEGETSTGGGYFGGAALFPATSSSTLPGASSLKGWITELAGCKSLRSQFSGAERDHCYVSGL